MISYYIVACRNFCFVKSEETLLQQLYTARKANKLNLNKIINAMLRFSADQQSKRFLATHSTEDNDTIGGYYKMALS